MRKLFFSACLYLMMQLGFSTQGFSQLPYSFCANYHCNGVGLSDVHFDVTFTAASPALPPFSVSAISDNTGCVAIPGGAVPPNSTITFDLFKDGDPLEGVNTLDLIQISRHILGIAPLDSPYKIIAADANKSGSITAFDVVEFQKLILGIYTELPNNTTWRFVNSSFMFPDPANPFSGTMNPDTTPILPGVPETFYGIKTGDVDCSAMEFFQASDEEELTMPNLYLQANEIAEVPISFLQNIGRKGFQFGLQFDPAQIELVEVIPALGTAANYASFLDRINMSWFDMSGFPFLPNQPIYSLRIKALTPLYLADAFSLNTEKIHAESYLNNDVRLDLKLQFGTVATSEPNAAQQILDPTPNPTTTGVTIPLRLESSETVVVELLNELGQLIYQQKQTTGAGAQWIELPATAFPQAGVYLWRVQAGAASRSGKIVKQ